LPPHLITAQHLYRLSVMAVERWPANKFPPMKQATKEKIEAFLRKSKLGEAYGIRKP